MSDPAPSEFVTIAKVGAVAEGQGITVVVGERLIALFLSGGTYYAIDDACPHMGFPLKLEAKWSWVRLPLVTYRRFRAQTAPARRNPRIKIGSFPVRVVGDEIQVQVSK